MPSALVVSHIHNGIYILGISLSFSSAISKPLK